MAAGLNIYTATRSTNGTTVLYTVPAGVSVQTVQIRYALSYQKTGAAGGTANLKFNGVTYQELSGSGSSYFANTISIALTAGDILSLEVTGLSGTIAFTCKLFVSGYTTP